MKQVHFLFIFGFLLLSSCSAEIEDNQRILIEGRVINENGKALSGIEVKTEGSSFLLGEGTTTEDGTFSFTSLKTNRRNITITINQRPDQINTPLNSIVFEYNGLEIQRNYELGDIILRDTAIFNFNIEKTSVGDRSLNWSLRFINGSCERIFTNRDIPNQNLCYEDILFATENNSDRPDFSQQFLSIRNTEATFTYRIDQGVEQTVVIPINEETTSYVFEY